MGLKTGYDYHLALPRRAGKQWYAFCRACGFQGVMRDSKSAAEDDCRAHDETENGGK